MSLPMGDYDGEGGGGQLAAMIEELSLGFTGGGVDRIGALPDDILHSILLRLHSTSAAARTSVLSRRWRHLWSQLPEVRFPFPCNPASILPALAANSAPVLRLLHVACRDDASANDWLRLAASRLAEGGELYFYNRTPGEEKEQVKALSWQCPTFELPCFETAAKVWLRLGLVDLALPPAGVLAGLTELRLEHVNFECGFELDDMVSSPRCPVLRGLRIARARGLVNLAIHSQTLVRLELEILSGLEKLMVVAPMLSALNVHACFAWRKPIAAIYAPGLELVWWNDAFDPSSVTFGEVAHLQQLTTFTIPVYGRFDYKLLQDYVMLLQHFPVVSRLDLVMNYERDLDQYKYLLEMITKLPNIEFFSLWLYTKGHAIGASVFHLLRMCPGIRKLRLTLLDDLKVDTPCPLACPCGQTPKWATRRPSLDCLEEVEIRNFRGVENDGHFVDLLFDMSTVIKKMTVTFHHLADPSEKLCRELRSLSTSGTCFEIHRNTSDVVYEPPSSLFPKTPDDRCDY